MDLLHRWFPQVLLLVALLCAPPARPYPADLDRLEHILEDLVRSQRSEVDERSQRSEVNERSLGSEVSDGSRVSKVSERSQRSEVDERSQKSEETESDLGVTSLVKRGLQAPPLKVAAFNIRVYGARKYSNPLVREQLVKILLRYDVTLVQEIRDKDPTSFLRLIDDIRAAGGAQTRYVLSKRLGRSSSKEQYAFIYNADRLRELDHFTYNDTRDDFERPPFCVHFYARDAAIREFGIVGIHTKPLEADREIDNLTDVYETAARAFRTQNIILMGDFNGDCSYVTSNDSKQIRLRTDPRFKWLIGDGVDTTIANTNCAYDRFVVAGAALRQAVVPGSARPFHFDAAYRLNTTLTQNVSDHYPIEMELYGQVAPEVTATPVRLYVNVTSPVDASGDILRMIKSGRTFRYFAYLRPSVVRVNNTPEVVELTRSEDCDDIVPRLDALCKQRPELMSPITVGLVQAYTNLLIAPPTPQLPGILRAHSVRCSIKIRYRGHKYDIIVAKEIQ